MAVVPTILNNGVQYGSLPNGVYSGTLFRVPENKKVWIKLKDIGDSYEIEMISSKDDYSDSVNLEAAFTNTDKIIVKKYENDIIECHAMHILSDDLFMLYLFGTSGNGEHPIFRLVYTCDE